MLQSAQGMLGDALPHGGMLADFIERRKALQIELALLFLGRVAFQAILAEQRADVLIESLRFDRGISASRRICRRH